MRMGQEKTVYLIGCGMGTADTLTAQAKDAIRHSDALLGAKRMLAPYLDSGMKTAAAYLPDAVSAFLQEHPAYRTVSVLLSGDVGFYSSAAKLYASLDGFRVAVIPGISSLQYFCAQLHIPWENIPVVSLHQQEQPFIVHLKHSRRLFLLTGKQGNAAEICRELCRYRMENTRVCVGVNLGTEHEEIISGQAHAFTDRTFAPLHVVLLEQESFRPPVLTAGIPDSAFLRGRVPMTKQDVRALTLSRLQPRPQEVLFDIGAGTGSVSIEASLLMPDGMVYAVEQNQAALDLIEENRYRFGCDNLKITAGTAPNALAGLPAPDKVFLGGTKGNMQEILECVIQMNPAVSVVANAITLETLHAAVSLMEHYGFETEIIQAGISVSKTAGRYHMMTAQNPVFIVSGSRKEACPAG